MEVSMFAAVLPLEARLILGLTRREYAALCSKSLVPHSATGFGVDRPTLTFSSLFDILEIHIANVLLLNGKGRSDAHKTASEITESYATDVDLLADRSIDCLKSTLYTRLSDHECDVYSSQIFSFFDNAVRVMSMCSCFAGVSSATKVAHAQKRKPFRHALDNLLSDFLQ